MIRKQKIESHYKFDLIRRNDGFTLVQLSVVLVIIGLLVGGVMVGYNMKRNAEINSITAELEKFKTVANLFEQKYGAYPGDFKNATNYWGAAANCSLDTTNQTTVATCNGNGDGIVKHIATASRTDQYNGSEYFLFWKHLANAGLISGNYKGRNDWSATFLDGFRSTPLGKISGSVWYMNNWKTLFNACVYTSTCSIASWAFEGEYNHTFQYGAFTPSDASLSDRPIITAVEAQALDNKFDDGKPGTGTVRVRVPSAAPSTIYHTCAIKRPDPANPGAVEPAVNTDYDTAVYNVTSTGNQCLLFFPNAF